MKVIAASQIRPLDVRGGDATVLKTARSRNKLSRRAKAIPLAEQALTIYEQIENPHAPMLGKQLEQWRKAP